MITAMLDLVGEIRHMPPYWQCKAIKALEVVVLDYQDWQQEGCPKPEVWETYKLVRHFAAYTNDVTVEEWRETLRAAGVALPTPPDVGGYQNDGE